jgi:hypothetical protein
VNLIIISNNRSLWDIPITLINKTISLIRLGKGGAAILDIAKRNQNKVIGGARLSIPLVRAKFRERVFSYDVFASIKRAEEHRP